MHRPYHDNWLLKGRKKSTPINRIPDDILYMIFRMVVIEMWQWKVTALRVSHVCSRWRSISLSTPILWSYISTKTAKQTFQRAFVKMHISRSGNALLTIEIGHRDSGCLQDVYNVCHRWKSAELIVPRPSIAELNASIGGKLSCLQHLKVGFTDVDTMEDYAEYPTCTAFLDAPMLRSVAFDVKWWDEEEDDMLLQWNQITSVDANCRGASYCQLGLPIFDIEELRSPNYVPYAGRHLTIQHSVAASTNPGSIYITSLTIDAWNINPPADGKDWLLGMSFPLLVELNVRFEFTRDPPCIDRIIDVVRTSAGIQRLSLVAQSIDATCTGDDILRIIRTANTPSLTELEVSEIWLHYGVRCPEMKSEEFLPELTSLRFVWTFHWGDDDENDPDFAKHRVGLWKEPAMADMLRTRCASRSSKLKSVALGRKDRDEISEDIVDVLHALRTKGIHTRVG
ncbi:hypothetical protein EV421DRAFT_1810192 [Armillaria borealis]|uniref:F-box domain-containing protein n=1 Tax=Armillaria borealis TaxID=47425 RepID=A0AA39MPG0_9AGAR|nr:hypothetical protein EV421DRAFT_1810192 [Armillaria borealis]